MKVILYEDVKNVGRSGDVVEVKDGFARNFLIPRNIAVPAIRTSLRALEHQKRLIAKRQEKRKKDLGSLVEQLQNRSVTVPKQVGKDDKLYGSVTPRDIESALLEDGIRINRKMINLKENIKSLGVYPVKITVDPSSGTEVTIKVWVVAK